jgi:hypothetical protein
MVKHILVSIFICATFQIMAQISTNSPYSSKGLGDTRFYGNAYLSSLGGSSAAVFDSTQVNLFNPSSYSLVAQQLPLFSLGINHQEKRFSGSAGESEGRFSGITHMSLVIPFANRLGLAFGLKPLSRAGYEVNDFSLVNGDSIFYDYTGSGSVQEFLLGFSGTLINRGAHQLTLGVNGKHYFGGISNTRRTYEKINGLEAGGQESRSLRASSFGAEVGMNYQLKLNSTHRLVVGGFFRPELNLGFNQSRTRFYYGNYANPSVYDTLVPYEPVDGLVRLPQQTNIGLTYVFTPDSIARSSKLPMLMLTMEYSSTQWSRYQESFDENISNTAFLDANSLRAGLEYAPHRNSADRSAYVNFFDKFRYRVGAYRSMMPFEVNNEQVLNQGVTAGIGIPLVINRAVSSVNFAFNYGTMGDNNSAGSLREEYFGVNFGINIAPSYDRWFRKYKLD